MEVKIIGRDGSNCDIIVQDPHISRVHLQIMKDDNGNVSILDLESSTGTYVNGRKIIGERKVEQGDIIKIGNTVLKWKDYFKTKKKITQEENIEIKLKKDVLEKKEIKVKEEIIKEIYYASFFERFAALLIDFVILTLVIYTIYYVSIEYLLYNKSYFFNIAYLLIFNNLILFSYFVGFEISKYKATPGKLILKIYVEGIKGEKASIKKIIGRYIAKFLSTLLLFIGWLMPLWTDKKQALHDILSDCRIVKINKHK